jgi:hypothetical protein
MRLRSSSGRSSTTNSSGSGRSSSKKGSPRFAAPAACSCEQVVEGECLKKAQGQAACVGHVGLQKMMGHTAVLHSNGHPLPNHHSRAPTPLAPSHNLPRGPVLAHKRVLCNTHVHMYTGMKNQPHLDVDSPPIVPCRPRYDTRCFAHQVGQSQHMAQPPGLNRRLQLSIHIATTLEDDQPATRGWHALQHLQQAHKRVLCNTPRQHQHQQQQQQPCCAHCCWLM